MSKRKIKLYNSRVQLIKRNEVLSNDLLLAQLRNSILLIQLNRLRAQKIKMLNFESGGPKLNNNHES